MAYARRLFCCRKQRAPCARGFGDGDAGELRRRRRCPGSFELPGGKVAQLLASSAPPTLASRSALSQAGGAGHGHDAPDVDPSAQDRLFLI